MTTTRSGVEPGPKAGRGASPEDSSALPSSLQAASPFSSATTVAPVAGFPLEGAAGSGNHSRPGAAPESERPISTLLGVRVLVVEDELMVALFIEDTLRELGCDVLEPAHTISDALARMEEHEIDAAVLDINIAEDEVYPVAEFLAARGVPFIFATGYALESIAEEWRQRPVIRKPYHAEQLRAALEQALRQADA